MADNNVVYRVGQLEDDVQILKTDVKKILINDLPHIQKEIVGLGERMNGLSRELKIFGGLILTAVGVLIAMGLS